VVNPDVGFLCILRRFAPAIGAVLVVAEVAYRDDMPTILAHHFTPPSAERAARVVKAGLGFGAFTWQSPKAASVHAPRQAGGGIR